VGGDLIYQYLVLFNQQLVDSRRRVIRLCAVIVLAFAVLSLPRYVSANANGCTFYNKSLQIYLTWSVWREANGLSPPPFIIKSTLHCLPPTSAVQPLAA
jgi:hypothetical protein